MLGSEGEQNVGLLWMLPTYPSVLNQMPLWISLLSIRVQHVCEFLKLDGIRFLVYPDWPSECHSQLTYCEVISRDFFKLVHVVNVYVCVTIGKPDPHNNADGTRMRRAPTKDVMCWLLCLFTNELFIDKNKYHDNT